MLISHFFCRFNVEYCRVFLINPPRSNSSVDMRKMWIWPCPFNDSRGAIGRSMIADSCPNHWCPPPLGSCQKRSSRQSSSMCHELSVAGDGHLVKNWCGTELRPSGEIWSVIRSNVLLLHIYLVVCCTRFNACGLQRKHGQEVSALP